jgi:hypothetical protein
MEYDELMPPYIYNGPLPKLKEPEITISMFGLTLRVSGYVPPGTKLPFYAIKASEDSKGTYIHIVYPMGSTDPTLNSLTHDGRVGQDAGGVWYGFYRLIPRRTSLLAYGGFPFLGYDPKNLISLHGPVDYLDLDEESPADDHSNPEDQAEPVAVKTKEYWINGRGYNSHGCKHLESEHIVELAHLVGIDMHRAWRQNQKTPLENVNPITITVLGMDYKKDNPWGGYDMVMIDGKGVLVDVKYPVEEWSDNKIERAKALKLSIPEIRRASDVTTGNTRIFPTWDARDFPNWVCKFDGFPESATDPVIDDSYCEMTTGKKNPDMKKDPRPVEEEGFLNDFVDDY